MLTKLYLICFALIVAAGLLGGPNAAGALSLPLSILIIVTPFIWLSRAFRTRREA